MDTMHVLSAHRAVSDLARSFAAAGHRLFLVGGCVRDAVLAETSGTPLDFSDLDFTTDAAVDDITAILSELSARSAPKGAAQLWMAGARHGTVAALIGGEKIEVTRHRADTYNDPDTRQPTVTFSDDVVEDLARRDLTINAVALALSVGAGGKIVAEIVDPFGGITDMQRRVIRTPGPPDRIICEDPLRSIRALRFMARFSAQLDGELAAAITRNAARLSILSAERIADELAKITKLGGPAAATALAKANELGVARALLGGLAPNAPMLATIERCDSAEILPAIVLHSIEAAPTPTTAEHARLGPLGLAGRCELAEALRAAELGPAGRALAALKLSGEDTATALRVAVMARHLATTGHDTIEAARLVRETPAGLLDAALRLCAAAGMGSRTWDEVTGLIGSAAILRGALAVNGHDAVAAGVRGADIRHALDAVTSAFLANPTLTRDEALAIVAATTQR